MKEIMKIPSGEKNLNDLPDELLISILSSLPIRDLGKTTAVCHRWRALWAHTSNLDLRCTRNPSHHVHSQSLNKILRSNAATVVKTCKMHLHENNPFTSDILLEKRVEKLWIGVCGCSVLSVPSIISSLVSLRELVIEDFQINNGSDFHGLVNLRVLHLRRVRMPIESNIADIVSGLPSLEKLCLWNVYMGEIRIRSMSLKKLEIGVNTDLKILEIYAPSLTDLGVDAYVRDGFEIYAPLLRALNTNLILDDCGFVGRNKLKRESRCQRIIELLELSSGIYQDDRIPFKLDHVLFSKLHKLSITLNLNDVRQIVVLAFVMIKECIFLKELEITCCKEVMSDSEGSCLPYIETDYWRRRALCPLGSGCISQQLESITIKDFRGDELELEFVRFLLTKATTLKRLVISHQCSGLDLEAFTYLLTSSKLQRASSPLELDIVVYPKIEEPQSWSPILEYYRNWLC